MLRHRHAAAHFSPPAAVRHGYLLISVVAYDGHLFFFHFSLSERSRKAGATRSPCLIRTLR